MKTLFLSAMVPDQLPLLAISAAGYYLALTGALLLVSGVVVFWAIAIRKPRKRRPRHHWRSQSAKDSAAALAAKAKETPPAEASRRRRRRSELPRNPTLAETRGLPPVREAQSGPDEHYQN
jgi:hypothetical protein